jgi:hypothetical protein
MFPTGLLATWKTKSAEQNVGCECACWEDTVNCFSATKQATKCDVME